MKWVFIIGLLLMSCSNPLEDINTNFFKRYPEYREYAEKRMEQERVALHNPYYAPIFNVSILMGKFRYLPEIINYIPDILVIFALDLRGDCDTASVLGEWALEEVGIPARRIKIQTPEGSHRIAISNDNKIFITTNSSGSADVVEIEGNDWNIFIKDYFEFSSTDVKKERGDDLLSVHPKEC